MENLALYTLLGTAFIGENVETIVPGKQLLRPIGSYLVAILGTNRDENTVMYVSAQEKALVGSKTVKLTVIPARTQAPVMVKVPLQSSTWQKRTRL